MSKNKLKRHIPVDVISEILERHSLGNVLNCSELTGGTFNSVLKVQTEAGNELVIKIAPDINTEILTYEKDLIKSEVLMYEFLKNAKYVHFPKIYGYNYTNEYPFKYLVMEFIEGQMLCDLKLGKKEYDKVMFDLGKAIAEIHTIVNENGFGYMQNDFKSTWMEAYLSMIDNIVRDGLKRTSVIPFLKKIRSIINKNSYVFDSVKTPSLVHFDLWAGNIITKDGKLYALIDCERAMFGDVMGDFISLDYVAPFDVDTNRHLIEGYNSVSKKKLTFNKEELIRLYLMKIYLGLIVFVETYYRSSKLSKEFYERRAFAKNILKNAIIQLDSLSQLNS